MRVKRYDHLKTERKWQKRWEAQDFWQAKDTGEKTKFYSLVEFPYPSGAGLHVGHVRSYTALDAISRYKRMSGYNVLYPIGWDAFGLPTENFAIKNKIHPRVATDRNIKTFKRQLKALGMSFDWTREVDTTDPKYYKWTQWIFLQLHKAGMAYRDEIAINWCPSCKTGLANEEVIDGNHERCGTAVTQKLLKQWLIRITKYADRLIDDLGRVDYLDRIKIQQKNWIGRKHGINITYPIEARKEQVVCFTTRPDTNFGATFVVLGPEHPLLKSQSILNLSNDVWKQVEEYKKISTSKTEADRIAEGRKKTGIFTGLFCTNGLTNYRMPLYVADFVLGDVGTGAVVGVPGHDRRDFEFAKEFGLEVKRVVTKGDGDEGPITNIEQVQEDEGKMINSEFLNGLDIHAATQKVMDYMEEKGMGKKVVTYKLRDWIFSRQHYWGEPIPIIYCEKCGEMPVPEEDLPVELPKVKNYEPTETGQSPLAVIKKFVETKCPKCKGSAKRETDTMPNWAGSNWYFLRYLDPKNDKTFADRKKIDHWMPVDLYNGGMEHTTLHLLYSRFIYKFLFDQGLVPGPEPYARRTSHGVILASDGRKMSKSFGNVINPDDIVKEYGADTLRLYEMFVAPFDQMVPWADRGVVGVKRFLDRVWKFYNVKHKELTETQVGEERKIIHKLIKKISADLNDMKFNTAVAAFMESLNSLEQRERLGKQTLDTYSILLAPFAPHITEELWQMLGHKESVHLQSWPAHDETLLKEDVVQIIVQVNGKMRDTVKVAQDTAQNDIENQALDSPKVQAQIAGKTIVKTIHVPGRIVNFVVK